MDRIETILKKGSDGSLYLEDRRTEVIAVTEFSKAYENRLCQTYRFIELKNDESLNVYDYFYLITFDTKGRDSSAEDLVFLKFRLIPLTPLYCPSHESINCRAEWTCLVSIVDSEGCLRYPQSLTLIYDGIQKSDLIEVQVVSADSLLREADVLLLDDMLTIQVDMVLKQYYAGERCKHITFGELLGYSFGVKRRQRRSRLSRHRDSYKSLRLDSPLGKLMCKESRYFERLCATSMAEKNSGYLQIHEEEKETFIKMVEILSYPHIQSQPSHLTASIKDILNIYHLAHFYGIERLLDTFRCWLRLICRNHSSCVTKEDASEISKLAETYDDPILRELVGVFTRNEGETKTQSGVEIESWTCGHLTEGLDIAMKFFTFEHPAKIKKKEHLSEDISTMSHCYI